MNRFLAAIAIVLGLAVAPTLATAYSPTPAQVAQADAALAEFEAWYANLSPADQAALASRKDFLERANATLHRLCGC